VHTAVDNAVRRGLGVAVVLGVAVALSSCGQQAPTSQSRAVVESPSAAASSTLVTSVTYAKGMKRFDPVDASYVPKTAADDAYATFVASKFYPEAVESVKPTIQLALYTDYGSGSIGADGTRTPDKVKFPVWVITFHNVTLQDVGPGNGSPVTQDVVALVSSETGKGVLVMTAKPDATVQAPITPNPDAKPKS
jgi:hypothetical protein